MEVWWSIREVMWSSRYCKCGGLALRRGGPVWSCGGLVRDGVV